MGLAGRLDERLRAATVVRDRLATPGERVERLAGGDGPSGWRRRSGGRTGTGSVPPLAATGEGSDDVNGRAGRTAPEPPYQCTDRSGVETGHPT